MFEHYRGWVEQLRKALDEWGSISVSGGFNTIRVAGMGGSGIVGDYLASLSHVYGGLPVFVYKTHLPPTSVSSSDLFFIVSYSGNTIETIRFMEMVRGKGFLVVVSSDGFLEKYALENNLAFIKVIGGLVPRTALPHMLYSILGLLDSSGYSIVSRDEAYSAYVFIRERIDDAYSEGVGLARFIFDNRGLLILATHSPYEALVVRGKNEFNENSKIPVKVEVSPEWMHNDIVGWEKPLGRDYVVVLVRDESDVVGSRLVDYMYRVYNRLGFPCYNLVLRGNGFLDKLLYGSLVFGFASVELARLRGVDPLVTESIVEYKSVVDKIFSV
ncbi:MAG: bifunctional phosphoglucose/phosphomannose isomerase [Desulfurococcales archaeon ex4484_58]|nr:MAG: bifunctional phosphoglucose/phosphomannose isomerase [Desulfurococcales archaeon ex4484_58]